MPTPAEIYAKQQVQKGKTKGNMGLTGGVTNYGAARPIPKTADIVAKPRSSNLEKFTEYGKNVGSSVGSVLKGIPNTIKKGGELFYSGVEPFLKPVAQALTGSLNRDLDRLAVQREGIDRQVQLANQMYGSGKMSKSNYKKAVAEAAKGYELISRESENIASQADRGDVVKGAANTLAIILSAGRYAPTTTTLRASARLATKPTMLGNNFTSQVLTGRAGPALFRLEEAAARIPSVKALLVRNGAFFSSTSRGVANQSIRDAAMGALIKYPFIYHYTIDDVEDIYKNINDGNPKGALGKIAWVTTLAFRGGILGAAGDVAKYGTSKVKLSAVGRESLLDNLSSRLGDKNARAWQNWLEEAKDETDKAKRLKQLRIMQEMNLQRWGNANDAVDAIAYHVTSNGAVDPSTITFAQFMEREGKYLDAYEEITNLAKAGKILDADGSPIAAGKIALGTFDRQAREQLIETISKMDYQKRLQYLSQLKEQNVFWAQNEIMFTKVFNAVAGTDDLSKVGKAVRSIDTQAALQGIPSRKVPAKLRSIVAEAEQYDSFEDFMAAQTIYRGQSKEFKVLQKVEESDAISNILIGRGVFTTSDKTIAKTYGENVFSLKKPKNAERILDLSEATTEQMDTLGIRKSTQKLYRELLAEGPDTGYYGKIYEIDGEQWRIANIVTDSKTKETQYKLANLSYGGGQKYINKDLFEKTYPPKTTYTAQKDAEDILFEQIAEKHLPDDITWNQVKMGGADALSDDLYIDEIRDRVLKTLTDKGFDWIKHKGGIRAGGGDKLHDVYIALNNKVLQPIEESKLKDAWKLSRQLDVAGRLAKDGYVVITPKNNLSKFVEEQDTRKLITSFVENGDEVFDITVTPQPILSGLYGSLRRAGLSAEAANDVAYRKLSETVSANLGDLGVAKNFVDLNMPAYDRSNMERAGRMILSKLQQYAEAKRPNALLSIGGRTSRTNAITDIRQLTLNEIQDALKVGKSDAKAVSRAVIEGYTQLPLELRGLGDRAVDKLFKYVPGFKGYNRLQSALRYTYNPFFRLQEITETKILSKMKSGNLLWGKRRADLDEVAQKLDNAGMFNTGFSGEGARDDVVLGRITANLTQYQKRDLAGLATKLSEVRGTNIDDMITNHMDELEDALKVVVQYPSRGIISSPLARTLNLAFFPMRYNLKVTGLVAQTLAKQPPTIQFAVINSTLDASKWLKTDEGLAWQSENSEAIGLLRWITPYGSLESVLNMLNGNVDSISDLGQLGGLPAGFIFQLFESQGTFENLPGGLKYSTPYVNPKTGEVYADKIPQTLKAKTAIAFSDFLNSVFTYPGRTLGLPGKGEAIRSVVSGIVPTKFDEYERIIRDDQLTELQRRQSELLKSKRLEDMTDDEILELYESPTGVGFAIPDLPLLIGTPTDFKKPLLNRTGLPSKSDNSRSGPKPKKVAQPVPPR